MSKEDREGEHFKLQRKYFRMLNNLLGLRRNGLINSLEDVTMETQLKKAKKELDNFII